jgi:Ser/Thr protein kinase RdoA (MazF antagonist)
MKGPVHPERFADLQTVLAHWDIPPITALQALDDGQRAFQVTTAGAAFTLKDISDAPNLSRLAFTDRVLRHVARTGLHVPLLLRSRSDELAVSFQGRCYTLYAFIQAGAYPSESALQAALFFQTGQAIAQLHRALASYPDPAVSQQTWRDDLASRVPGWITALGSALPEPQAAVVQRVGQARGAAIATALHGLPEQLIHRDCHPGNILVDGTRVVGFIDCDHLCIGLRIFDLAYYAVHHLKWVTDDPVATQGWLTNLPSLLAGYQSQQPVSHAERAALPYAMLAYHFLLAHWFLGVSQPESIGLEVHALDWIDQHFDAIMTATTSS